MKKRWVVVLELRKLSDTEKIEKAKEIRIAMSGNAKFPNPDPTMAQFNDQIVLTEASFLASRDAGTEKTTEFHNDMDDLERAMLSLADGVEIIANKHPLIGDEYILSAAMNFKEVSERNVQDFSVVNGKIQGQVLARAKALKGKVAYIWQAVPNDGGDFVSFAVTVAAKYTFLNLDSERKYKFRMAVVTKDGQGAWSDVLTLVVL